MKTKARIPGANRTTSRAKLQPPTTAPAALAANKNPKSRTHCLGPWQYIDQFQKETVWLIKDGRHLLAMDAGKKLWLYDQGVDHGQQRIIPLSYDDALLFLMPRFDLFNPHTPESFLRLHGILPPVVHAVSGSTTNPAAAELSTGEFETAKTEMCALLELLVDKLDHIATSGMRFEGPEADSIVSGISGLAMSARARMETAFLNLHRAIGQARHYTGGAQ